MPGGAIDPQTPPQKRYIATSKEHVMAEKTLWDVIKEKAIGDKSTDAPPPPALPTQEQQNWYDDNRNT